MTRTPQPNDRIEKPEGEPKLTGRQVALIDDAPHEVGEFGEVSHLGRN